MSEAKSTRRNARIDRLRGLAILTAVMSHTPGFMTWEFRPYFTNIASLQSNGCFAVAVFFVISGFLITRRLLSMGEIPAAAMLTTFYAQRIGRLFPCLVLVVVLAWLMSSAGYPRFVFAEGAFGRFIGCIAMLRYNRCIVEGGLPDILNHLWSLSVEEMFYLMFPLLVILTRKQVSMLTFCLAGLVVYGPLYRSTVVGADVYTFFGNFDLLAMGCLAAIHAPKVRSHHADLRWIGLILMTLTFFGVVLTRQLIIPPTIVGIGAALYVLGARPLSDESPILFRPLELAGNLSYEMYLFHFPILGAIVRPTYNAFYQSPFFAPYIAWLCLAVYMVSLFLISFVLARYFSQPANRLIRTSFSSSGQSFVGRPREPIAVKV